MTDSTQSQPAVSMQGISKAFGGVRALKAVNFDVMPGEIHALLGENGAGKSTLMKILQGVHQPDAGVIHIRGKPTTLHSPQDATQLGIGMVFQELSLIDTLTVSQNIFLTRETITQIGTLRDGADQARARAIFKRMNVDINPSTRVSQLTAGYQQLCEIAKALSRNAHVLILDEPTTALTESETLTLFDLLRRLKSDGIGIVYISHRMQEIFNIADRITVLRNGENVLNDHTDALTLNEVIEHIVGQKAERDLKWQPREVNRQQAPLFGVKGLVLPPLLNGIDLQLYPGEIVGIAGLMGSGRTELAEALFGITQPHEGSFTINGQPVRIRTPQDALKHHIALIPENRREQGLVLAHSLRDNFLLPLVALGRLTRRRILVADREGDKIVQSFIERLQIRTQTLRAALKSLSGGNQQKVVLAKWLSIDPDIMIMDEPTAGVDIGTKLDIVDMMRELAARGKGIILISSEMPELLAVSDRVYILRDGQFRAVLARQDITSEEQLHHMIQKD